jgi:hypothetical protein
MGCRTCHARQVANYWHRHFLLNTGIACKEKISRLFRTSTWANGINTSSMGTHFILILKWSEKCMPPVSSIISNSLVKSVTAQDQKLLIVATLI